MTATNTELPAMLSENDFATLLKINRRLVVDWVRRGLLPKPLVQTKRVRRWSAEQVREFMCERTTKA